MSNDEVQERELGEEDEGRRRKAALDGVKATASTARRKEVESEGLGRDAAACCLTPIATRVAAALYLHVKGVSDCGGFLGEFGGEEGIPRHPIRAPCLSVAFARLPHGEQRHKIYLKPYGMRH